MFNPDFPVVKDLVLVGGGHSHVIVLKKLGMQTLPGVRVTLISRELQSPYSGMLPGYVAGHYSFDDTHIDLLPLSRFAGARFFHDEVIGLDTENRSLVCKNRPDVSYDLLSIDIGSAPQASNIPGAVDNAIAVKPIDGFLANWERTLERIVRGQDRTRVGVVGAGAAGVELALSIKYRLEQECQKTSQDKKKLEFHLFGDREDVLPGYSPKVRAIFRRVLKERNIDFHAGHRVSEVSQQAVLCENGVRVELDEIFWATAAGAQTWPAEAGLKVDDQGFIKVNDTLESVSHAGIFASGDIAQMVNHPRPRAGVFAVRQGPALFNNLLRTLKRQPLKRFVPQKQFLSLISTGNQYAIASRSRWALEGRRLWRWKDWIDRRFMQRFKDLPAMKGSSNIDVDNGMLTAGELAALSDRDMRCGGCGGKVGAKILDEVLSQLLPKTRADVIIGLDQVDDAAVVSVPPEKLLVQTVDFFRSFVDDPYLFGQIAASHALNDIFAMGASPQTALAIVGLPYGTEKKVREELLQMMQGAIRILNEADTALTGGHTGEAQESSLGFAINGLVDRNQLLRKKGMHTGDKLIVTKALGTGTLFAADMRHRARAPWISGAIESMVQSNQEGARCLVEYGARACTDISGFGLLGHLLEMTRASAVNVIIELDTLPRLHGAGETLAEGIFSSLHGENAQLETAISNPHEVDRHPLYPLLFDPQTAGGLLASVPAERATSCVEALKMAGYSQTTSIGSVVERGTSENPVQILI